MTEQDLAPAQEEPVDTAFLPTDTESESESEEEEQEVHMS